MDEVDKRQSIQERLLDQSMEVEEAEAAFGLIFEVSQKQVINHRHPNLRHDRVFRRSQESLDLQVLLEPLEERLNLPAGFIDGGDG